MYTDGGDGPPSETPVSRFRGEFAHDFEIWTECYDSTPEMNALREHIPLERSRVLDAGCGTGRLTFRLAPYCRTVIGVDTHPELVRLCRSRAMSTFRSTVEFEVQDATALSYDDDSFDAVVDGWLFTGLDDPRSLVEEYRRVVANGGHIAVITGRNDSEYEDVLCRAGDHYRYDAATVESRLVECFGEPLASVAVVVPCTFRSLGEAYDAFDFHLGELCDDRPEGERRDAVHDRLREHRDGERVVVDEYARVSIFQNGVITGVGV